MMDIKPLIKFVLCLLVVISVYSENGDCQSDEKEDADSERLLKFCIEGCSRDMHMSGFIDANGFCHCTNVDQNQDMGVVAGNDSRATNATLFETKGNVSGHHNMFVVYNVVLQQNLTLTHYQPEVPSNRLPLAFAVPPSPQPPPPPLPLGYRPMLGGAHRGYPGDHVAAGPPVYVNSADHLPN